MVKLRGGRETTNSKKASTAQGTAPKKKKQAAAPAARPRLPKSPGTPARKSARKASSKTPVSQGKTDVGSVGSVGSFGSGARGLENSLLKQLVQDLEAFGGVHKFEKAKNTLSYDILDKRLDLYGSRGDPVRRQITTYVTRWKAYTPDEYKSRVVLKYLTSTEDQATVNQATLKGDNSVSTFAEETVAETHDTDDPFDILGLVIDTSPTSLPRSREATTSSEPEQAAPELAPPELAPPKLAPPEPAAAHFPNMSTRPTLTPEGWRCMYASLYWLPWFVSHSHSSFSVSLRRLLDPPIQVDSEHPECHPPFVVSKFENKEIANSDLAINGYKITFVGVDLDDYAHGAEKFYTAMQTDSKTIQIILPSVTGVYRDRYAAVHDARATAGNVQCPQCATADRIFIAELSLDEGKRRRSIYTIVFPKRISPEAVPSTDAVQRALPGSRLLYSYQNNSQL